jgi:site-specific recombinase XerD
MPYRKKTPVQLQNPLTASYWVLMASYERSLRAQNLRPRTIAGYLDAARLLGEFLQRSGMPLDAGAITREHVESWLVAMAETPHQRTGKPVSPATLSNRYKSVQPFFKWLLDEDEISRNPMARMKPPRVPESLPPVIPIAELKTLISSLEADKTFYGKRDLALVRLLIDTGLRRSEIAGIQLEDINWNDQSIRVVGKSGKTRDVPFGVKATRALDRYVRARAGYDSSSAGSPALWLGAMGPLTHWGIADAVKHRAKACGLEHVHTHIFRHSWAHHFLLDGGQGGDLMTMAGWSSRQMLDRYARSGAAERARSAHRRHSPGDKI